MDPQLTESERSRIRTRRSLGDRRSAEATVVVVTYGRERSELTPTLDALAAQSADSYEVLVLDNGTDWDLCSIVSRIPAVTEYVAFTENVGVNVARNVGAKLAQGDLLIFLDDDAVPRDDFVEQHCSVHDTRDIVAARGKVEPKSATFYNRLAAWYDLGDESVPYLLDIEGNTSVDRTAFLAVSGFNEEIWGHEGVELTDRLIDYAGRDRIIYYPHAVIYHDFVTDFRSVVRKKARHRYYRRKLEETHPELFTLVGQYADVPAASAADRSLPVKSAVFLFNRATDWLARRFESRFVADRHSQTESVTHD